MKPKEKKKRSTAGREARRADIENLKKAQGKQTGPTTKEGKEITSMNAVSTGEQLRNFHRISKQAGQMSICENCGDEQIVLCTEAENCLLHDYFIAQYHKARADNDVAPLEEINFTQLPDMDFMFTIKLKYALDNIGEMTFDKDKGRNVPLISWDYIYGLLNMFSSLNKKLDDMQMTRKTQGVDGGELKDLLKRSLDTEGEKDALKYILEKMDEFKSKTGEAKEMREQDDTIKEFEKTQSGAEVEENINIENVTKNPFKKETEKNS